MKEAIIQKLLVIEKKILRRIFGLTKENQIWRVKTSEELDKLIKLKNKINPLNPELNPICYLLTLLGAHHFLHVSRIRVKLLTFRLPMSYIYIYIWSTHS